MKIKVLNYLTIIENITYHRVAGEICVCPNTSAVHFLNEHMPDIHGVGEP